MTKGLLTVEQVANLLNVSKSLVYRLKDEGHLPYYKIARGVVRFTRDDVNRYLASCLKEEQRERGTRKKASASPPFKCLDGDRLLAEWRRRGVHIDRQDGRNTPTSE